MQKGLKGLFGRGKGRQEEEQWIASLQGLLSDEDPQSLPQWLSQNMGRLDQSFASALTEVSDRLLSQTSLTSTQQLFRLQLFAQEIVQRTLTQPWNRDLLGVLRSLEEDGVGPRSTLSKTPADVYKRVLNYRGCGLAERGEYMAAIEHFKLSLEIDPEFAPAYCNRARAWLELNQLDKAQAECERLRSFDPNYSIGQATCQLVETLHRLKASREGTLAEIAEEHGLLELMRRYDRPLKPGEQAAASGRSVNPLETSVPVGEDATPQELNHLGVVRGRSGDYNGALEAFNRALELDPEYEEARYNRGKAYQLAGEYEKAIAEFSFIIVRNPEDTDAYHLRAQSYRALGETVAAEADEKRARRR